MTAAWRVAPPLVPPDSLSDTSETLDPDNWNALRAQGHRMLDDMFDHIAGVRDRPVWQPIPAETRKSFVAVDVDDETG